MLMLMNKTDFPKKGILLILISLAAFMPLLSIAQEPVEKKISLLFMGDIMGHDEQIWSAEDRETHTYNYDDVFKYIKPAISEADIAIGNLEVTLGGPPYKGYPAFSSPAALAVSCKNAGIDCLVTANNHSADRGKKGIINTILRLDSIGIPHTGTFTDSLSREKLSPLIIEKNGITLALLNYTFGTNGIKVPKPVIVNMLDKEIISRDILLAKEKNPDLIVLFLHWGNEYDTIPSKNQTGLAEYFFSEGVGLVIGSHPHVIQKMVWEKGADGKKDGLVAYSLGNFVSNQRKAKTDGGTMIRIEIEKKEERTYITNAEYILTWVYTPIEKYRKRFFILPCLEFEKKPEFFSNSADLRQMKRYIVNSRSLLNPQNINVIESNRSFQEYALNY
jgi:poly-gamma-glutamate capsule biosynthesis protein CapA/YwtB (metallophosphatase superfamily)